MWKRLRLAAWYRSVKRGGRQIDRTLNAKNIDRVIESLERYLEITSDQQEAWDRCATTVRDGAEAFRASEDGPDAPAADAVAALARLDATMEAGSMVLRRVRPAFEGLYRVLSERQRRVLDDLIAAGGHGGGSRHRAPRVPPALWPVRHRYHRAAGW